jgi:hypothetical protein
MSPSATPQEIVLYSITLSARTSCDFSHFTIQGHRLNVRPRFEQEVPMRSHHAIAIAAIILTGFGVKVFFFTPSAVAEVHGVSMNISRMHENKNLPAQNFHDMTFVFSDAD